MPAPCRLRSARYSYRVRRQSGLVVLRAVWCRHYMLRRGVFGWMQNLGHDEPLVAGQVALQRESDGERQSARVVERPALLSRHCWEVWEE